jgi:Helix-turn-helix domain
MRLTEARQGVRVLKFIDVFGRWEAASLSQWGAAELLGVGERTFRRWCRRYKEEGEAGLLDRRIGKASGRRVPVDRCEGVEHLYRTRYQGFTARHFHEHRFGTTGSRGATVGRRPSCRAGICCQKPSVAGRTVASGRVVRCPG